MQDKTTIAVYDTGNNSTRILELIDVAKANQAEIYGILYAMIYIIKNGYNRCHILNDSQNATTNKIITQFAQSKNISISWIPRETNKIADKTTKLAPTVKVGDWYLLKLFYELLFDQV